MIAIFAIFTSVNFAFGSVDPNSGWQKYPPANTTYFITTNDVTNWSLVENVNPTLTYSIYSSNIESLSTFGPVGSYGPLGLLGPLFGTDSWNTSNWINDDNWNEWAEYSLFGPLSEAGPLGHNGPYTSQAYYYGEVFLEDPFDLHLRALGVWSILGPIGPLGAVGALGAIGPIGATGYSTDANGNYLDIKGNIVYTYIVPYNSTFNRSFDLYQFYTASYAQSQVSDTSFLSQDTLVPEGRSTYCFRSSQDQIVSVLVVPLAEVGIFQLILSDSRGNVIATSLSQQYVNFVVFTAHSGQTYSATVSAAPSSLNLEYRIFVTGSFTYLNLNNLTGRYIQKKIKKSK